MEKILFLLDTQQNGLIIMPYLIYSGGLIGGRWVKSSSIGVICSKCNKGVRCAHHKITTFFLKGRENEQEKKSENLSGSVNDVDGDGPYDCSGENHLR